MGIPYIWAFTEEALENRGLLSDPIASGSMNYVDGKIGSAVNVQTSGYVDFEESDALNNDHHTICFWMKMNASSASYKQLFLASSDNTSEYRSPLIAQIGQKLHLRYTDIGITSGVNSGPADFGEGGSGTDFILNEWYHITIVKNANILIVYVNGDEVSNRSDIVYPSYPSRKIRLFNSDAEILFNDFRVYPSVLNIQEIKDIARGLVGHWKLEKSPNDCSGYGQNGTSTGTDWSTPTRQIDSAVNYRYGIFNSASSSSISIADVDVNRLKKIVNADFTISLWFRTAGHDDQGSVFNALLALNNVGDAFSFGIVIDDNNDLRFYSVNVNEVLASPSLNEWHNLIVSRQSDGTLTAYLDNVEIENTSKTYTTETEVASTFYIGRDASSLRYYTGDLSDVRIYASILDGDARTEIYTNRAKLSSDSSLRSNSIRMEPLRKPVDNKEYVVFADSTYDFVSYEDNTEFFKNGVSQGTTTTAYTTKSISTVEGDIITADKKFVGPSTYANLIPTSWEGREFLYYFGRNLNGEFKLFALDYDSDYEIYLNGSLTTSGSISSFTMETFSITSTGSYLILATEPLLVHVIANANNDSMALFPAREELYGIPTSGFITAGNQSTNVTLYESDGTVSTTTISANASYSIPTGGGSFVGPSLKIIADYPISAKSQGDGDGSESSLFAPRTAMATKFVLAETVEFVAFVGIKSGATVSVYNPSGTLIGTENVTGGGVYTDGEAFPTHLKITTDGTYLNTAGWHFVCSDPMLAYVDDSGGNENLIYGSTELHSVSYAEFEVPTRAGVIHVEKITEVGIDDTDELIFWTPLDIGVREISGTVSDYTVTFSGNGEPTRINNMSNGGAYRFDNTAGGASDYYIDYDALPYSNITTELTASVWVKLDQQTISERETIFAWENVFFICHTTGGKFNAQSYDDNSATWKGVTSSISPDTTDWYHLVITYDGTDYKIYVDGAEDNSASQSITFVTTGDENVRIGDASWGAEGLDGSVSQCMIFSRALSAKEINTLYKLQSNNSAMQRSFDGSLVVRQISDAING
jgi:hypothetical protein